MTWDELILIPQWDLALQVIIRLLIAAILGGSIGYERELKGKAAGIRTHMLVCVGTTIIIIVARLDGIPMAEMSKVIEGVVAGIGFIGGGVILKLTQEREIRGITTAAGIWTTAAIGIAVGLGQVWIAVVSALAVWLILSVLGYLEKNVWGMDEDKA
ncbi:MAG: MgtC/SapB family protein [Caldilineaceae bacterium]|nr:MgtC/SapB family protein [Caldilineaceae bacterium]